MSSDESEKNGGVVIEVPHVTAEARVFSPTIETTNKPTKQTRLKESWKTASRTWRLLESAADVIDRLGWVWDLASRWLGGLFIANRERKAKRAGVAPAN